LTGSSLSLFIFPFFDLLFHYLSEFLLLSEVSFWNKTIIIMAENYHKEVISGLKNKSLFIQDAFIDGQWVAKENKFDVFGR
jgi:hypothetical protein